MAPKRNKAQKVALSDFLADDKHGSWADEMEALPTAPASRPEGERLDTGDFMSRPDRAPRGEFAGESRGFAREEIPLPTSAPFTAYVGNLSFEVGEADVETLFSGLSITSIKIISDFEGKPKGFGYVEFGTLDDLKQAMARTGESVGGRTVRISVAEPPKNGVRSSQFGGAADEKSSWRREGPLPALENTRRPNNNRFDSGPAADDDRDWSSARGSKFVPSSDTGSRFGGPDRREGVNPGAAEAASQWRTGKPLAGSAPGGFGGRDAPPHQRTPRADVPPSAADAEDQWTRGKNFVASPLAHAPERQFSSGPRAGVSPVVETSDWRSSTRKPAFDRSPNSSNNASPVPLARKPMTLLPRSGSTVSSAGPSSPDGSVPSSPKASSKASPFGAARAIDVSAREKEIQEKRLKAEAERKAAKEQERAAVVLAKPIEVKEEPSNWRERPAKGAVPLSQQAQKSVRGERGASAGGAVEDGEDDETDEVEAVTEGVEKTQI
ncbi:FOG: RRM domain [Phaffia rhodozyma]|uniref:FOG: RRM domain n=1 Tax=Phaffia rhodozyma TaxID=264483 RepID=A0A0F7STR0_PHARH|nr:FOG: RRM domain [Phaffia rhodozyma]